MDYLFHIILALVAQAAAESGVRLGGERPLIVALLVVVPFGLARISRILYIRGRFRLAGFVWNALFWSPPILHAIALGACGWLASLEHWLGAAPSMLAWPTPSVFLGFAPFLVYTIVSIDVRVRTSDAYGDGAARARRFHLRMFFSALAPLAIFALAAWLIGTNESLRAHLEEVGVYSVGFVVVAASLFIVALPWILRGSWDTRSIEPGPTRTLLEDLAARAKFRYRDLLVWRTGHMVSNAAIVGLGAAGRVVLFSDSLLSTLDARELAAVFGHEMGHAKHRHVLIFLVWTAAVFLGVELVGHWIESELLGSAIAIALFVIWYFLFGWLSRRFELEADLFALELTHDPEALIAALERVGSVHTRALSSWRHFSTERRVEFIAQATSDPTVGRKLRLKLAWLVALGVVAAFIAACAEMRQLAKDYPRDEVEVALRLGEYGTATERFAKLDVKDEELAKLVERAKSFAASGREPTTTALEAEARAALFAGEPDIAFEWLALAEKRGSTGLEDVASIVKALNAGASDDDLAELRREKPQWAAAVDACVRVQRKTED